MNINDKPALTQIFNQKTGDDGATGIADALPCLYSHNSTEQPENDQAFEFTTGRKRSAFVLAESVEKLCKMYGINKVGFLTLTFKKHVVCPKEAQKCLNSFFSHVLKPRYTDYVGVFERTKTGRIHYHLLVALPFDIKTGFDFKQVADTTLSRSVRYSSASKELKAEWAFLRKTVVKYGFGPRVELMPVKTNIDAIKFYVGKYIGKSLKASHEGEKASHGYSDKGVRLVRYSKGARAGTTRFAWASSGASSWRNSVAFFADLISMFYDKPVLNVDDLSDILGFRWAFKYREYVLGISGYLDMLKQAGIKLHEFDNWKTALSSFMAVYHRW